LDEGRISQSGISGQTAVSNERNVDWAVTEVSVAVFVIAWEVRVIEITVRQEFRIESKAK
jgi:hypothetical protein